MYDVAKQKNKSSLAFPVLMAVYMVSFSAEAFQELTDSELNHISAGNSDYIKHRNESVSRIPFKYSGRKGSVEGEVIVLPMSTYNTAASLLLMDNAQSNLRSLINVNAVNSPVQIMLNLNINVNSSIGNINQLNNLIPNNTTF